MKIKEIVEAIEKVAPRSFQEEYDNAGLIVGDKEIEIKGILLSLDVTEELIDEAIEKGCNLIVSHHPIIFKGLKKINGNNYVERCIIKAIKNDIALYACHTNLDNVLKRGVNQKVAQKLGLNQIEILAPKSQILSKLIVYAPLNEVDRIKAVMFEHGAGNIGEYSECSFTSSGIGTFNPSENANPSVGNTKVTESVEECKIEVLVERYKAESILKEVKKVHSYEEIAYEIVTLENKNQEIGSGAIGFLPQKMNKIDFLNYVKEKFNLKVIKFSGSKNEISRVAVCGGSGSFLTSAAKAMRADAYITSDIKYHEFFDAENELLLMDIGHYESEIYTLEIFYEIIKEKMPNFAVIFCTTNTNSVQYYI